MTLSFAQQNALDRIGRFGEFDHEHRCHIYMPYRADLRTFMSLEKRGLVEYVRVENGFAYNGYRKVDTPEPIG